MGGSFQFNDKISQPRFKRKDALICCLWNVHKIKRKLQGGSEKTGKAIWQEHQKKAYVAIFVSGRDKVALQARSIIRDLKE